ncbi:ATP-binding cassette domain-containing protein [Sporosalibacterium faouarense]|uniref:ATP-binding cassette domain-containing protein n=1 Tax=Sporosalibacterium faouarense TaxID=516123 RepID=UPI00192B4639|nr:ABC transporter [Sporosalibacterium faouarense]
MKSINNPSSRLRKLLIQNKCLNIVTCNKCNGTGLSQQAIHTTVEGKTITDLENMSIRELHEFLNRYKDKLYDISLLSEILVKLKCMIDVGLYHLTLCRPIPSLSGGEIQRLFLATFVIADMDSIIFVFDEPTIGLHEIEKINLIRIIKNLVNKGNTVVVVEHDKSFIETADYIIDLGPGAGVMGGERIFQGNYNEFMSCNHSQTAPFLSGVKEVAVKKNHRTIDRGKVLTIKNANKNNLQNLSLDIPLGVIVGVAGVSGSGKSSLITQTLVPNLKEILKRKFVKDVNEYDNYKKCNDIVITGFENIKKCIVVDQRPIGRSKTSCPATYVGILDRIRNLFANTPQAMSNEYTAGLFSINSHGGCGVCNGDGVVQYNIGYGNFIELECKSCGGTGFVEEAMEIKICGKNIREVLEMTVLEGVDFFHNIDEVTCNMLKTLNRVGLGYIKLGQKTTTISGGEAQRIKLAKELAKNQVKNSLYIMDEPTTGLSFTDREDLMTLVQELCDAGNTIIITEHDPVVLSNCDYIIELGPGGGNDGGYVIATGTPKEIKTNDKSIIGRWLYE